MMKKKEVESSETRAEFLPHGDSLKRVELAEQVVATRNDTRLSLHVMHGTVSVH